MLLTPIRNSKYSKWKGRTDKFSVKLELRPLLDKWDVIYLENKYMGTYNWYMRETAKRFGTMREAILFILKNFSDTIQIKNDFNEVETHNLKEYEMTKAVETITLVYGKDSRNVSDDEIFEHIRKLEGKINQLQGIQNQPKKLKDKVNGIHEDINALVNLVDSR